jgi:hypothetical protein
LPGGIAGQPRETRADAAPPLQDQERSADARSLADLCTGRMAETYARVDAQARETTMATRKRAEPVKRGRGRPPKYDKRNAKQAYELALLGLTDDEMAPVFGVTVRTIARWKKDHPDFCHAVTRGKIPADAEVAAKLRERAIGYSHQETVITSYQGEITQTVVTRHYPPETAAASMWLHNRQPTRWRRDPDPTDAPDAPTPVKVVVEVKDARRPADDAQPQSAAG